MGTLEERQSLVEQVFKQHDRLHKGSLGAEELQDIHCDMRIGGISIPQVGSTLYELRNSISSATLQSLTSPTQNDAYPACIQPLILYTWGELSLRKS